MVEIELSICNGYSVISRIRCGFPQQLTYLRVQNSILETPNDKTFPRTKARQRSWFICAIGQIEARVNGTGRCILISACPIYILPQTESSLILTAHLGSKFNKLLFLHVCTNLQLALDGSESL